MGPHQDDFKHDANSVLDCGIYETLRLITFYFPFLSVSSCFDEPSFVSQSTVAITPLGPMCMRSVEEVEPGISPLRGSKNRPVRFVLPVRSDAFRASTVSGGDVDRRSGSNEIVVNRFRTLVSVHVSSNSNINLL